MFKRAILEYLAEQALRTKDTPPDMARFGAGQHRGVRTALGIVVLLAAALTTVPGAHPVRADEEQGLVAIRKWAPTIVPTIGADQYLTLVQVYPESATRRLYAVGIGDGFVGAYNLDTLEPLGPGLQLGGQVHVVAADGVTGGAFVSWFDGTRRPYLDFIVANKGTLAKLATTDLVTTSPQLAGHDIVGLYRPPGSNVLWVMSGVLARTHAGNGISISEFDITDPTKPAKWHWTTPLPNCPAPVLSGDGTMASMGYANKAIYFGCSNPGFGSAGVAGVPRGAARLSLDRNPRLGRTAPGAFLMFARDGEFSTGQSYWDPASHRLTMAALSAGVATTYVFDADTENYVGNVSTGKNSVVQAGVNAITGRYYAATAASNFGIVAAELRATPATQGQAFPSFGPPSNFVAVSNSTLGVDSLGKRIFVRYGSVGGTDSGKAYFVIAEDRLPTYVPPLPADPDINTSDVEESEGKTESAYAAAGQGFGSRWRQIGGTQTLEGNLSQVGADFTGQAPFGRGTREIRGADLNHLAVLNNESAASAISVDRDRGNTQGDLDNTHAPPDVLPPDFAFPPGVDPYQPVAGWPVEDAFCADFGGEPKTESVDNASATCDQAKRVSTASATFAGGFVNGIGVGNSALESKAHVDNKVGASSKVTSVARDVSVLAGALQIREVSATATATARGRKGTAKATWERAIYGVTINGQRQCDQQCDPRQVFDAVNTAFGGKVTVLFPQPTITATPGGYEATVRRSEGHQLEEVLLNNEYTDRLEVPAMVIMVVEDGPKASRTRIELAAVEAEARYGISVIGGGDGGIGGGEGTLLDALTGGLLGSDDAQSPLAPSVTGGGGTGGDLGGGVTPRNTGGGALSDAGRLIWNGLRGMARLLPIWAVLLAPIYLSARRWLLLQRERLVSGGTT